MPRVDAPVRSMIEQFASAGSITRDQATQVLEATLADKTLSRAERKELIQALATHADKFEPDAKSAVQTLLNTRLAVLRQPVLDALSDGVVDLADAQKLLNLVTADGKITGNEKYSLRSLMVANKMTPDAQAAMAAKVGGASSGGTVAKPTLDLNLPQVEGSGYRLSPEGHFQVGAQTTPPRFDEHGALATYRAATALAAAPRDVLKDVPTDVKANMVTHLDKCFDAGQNSAALPQVSKARMRSGAATALLAVIEGCKTPADKAVKDKAVSSFLKHAAAETDPGLRASMYFNLKDVAGSLSTEQKKSLGELASVVVPQRPEYEKWFANNGERTINVKHYAHDECWIHGANPETIYAKMGFKLIEKNETAKPPRYVYEKTNANAPGGEVKMRVEVLRTHDGLFDSMDDAKTNAIFYTGHSNLGGNVSEELRLGTEEAGNKFVMLGMCRGKQNIPEFANKHPNTHFVTTDAPSYFSSMPAVVTGAASALLGLKDYQGMQSGTGRIWDENGNANYFYPNEERRYALYDLDRDGRVDAKGSARDRLFDVGLSFPKGTKVDLQPRDNDYKASELDGGKVLHAVQFLNSLTTYHVDHGHNSSKLDNKDMDAFLGGGWFEGPKDEAVRVKKETVDGKTMYRVSVNKAFADQSQFALGAMVQFETIKQMLADRNGGTVSTDDKLRALLFSGEYLAYMYCSYEEAHGSIRGLAAKEGMGGLNFDKLMKAIDADGHGYVTDAQVAALRSQLNL